jgi:hypothetical protein
MSLNAANNEQLEAIRIEFVLPEPREPQPKPVDVTPPQPAAYAADAKPDYSVPAIAAPPERIETRFGIIERRGPSYQSQTGEPMPSVFDRPAKSGWMK